MCEPKCATHPERVGSRETGLRSPQVVASAERASRPLHWPRTLRRLRRPASARDLTGTETRTDCSRI